jgi:TrmH family RNA methyltransferase
MLSTRFRPVTSRQNSRVKELRAAAANAGRDGLIALEGEHLVEEAARSGLRIVAVFVVNGCEDRLPRLLREGPPLQGDCDLISLPPDVFSDAVSTETPQPIAALAIARQSALIDVLGDGGKAPLIVVAAGLQDPGNLGTLVRSAEAFGATGFILLPGTASLWNAKTLRASSGSAFRLPCVQSAAEEMFEWLSSKGVRVLAAVPDASAGVGDLRGPSAILIGNEGAGISRQLLERTDARIAIPCPGVTESLNAAVAGSILLYEASRQRSMP